jgi:tetratricopeptide (TPR) repeat protein
LLPLGAIGLWLLARRKTSARTWLGASLGLYWLVLALFFITDRYRLLAWPYLALLAGIGVEGAWRAWETRDRRVAIGMAAAALLALLLSFLPPAPRFSPGHMSLILSDVLAARGDAPGARQALIAAAATGEIYEAAHNLANAYFKEHRYAEAAAEYERALAIEPEAVETLYGLALTELERGRAPAALAALARGRALAPNDPRIADAIARAQAAVALAEQEARAPAALPGVESSAIGAGDSSRALARRDARRAIYAQALADARAGQRAAARTGFERVLVLDPQDAGAHLNLALLAESEGNFTAAAAALKQAATFGASSNLEWLLCAGRLAARAGQRGEAEAHFRQAAQVAPADPRPPASLRALDAMVADSTGTTGRNAPSGAKTPTPAPEGRASTNHGR